MMIPEQPENGQGKLQKAKIKFDDSSFVGDKEDVSSLAKENGKEHVLFVLNMPNLF